MKVFISWSGERSRAIAEAFHIWLPTIIQQVEPWMSEHDIDKGTRGLATIAQQLEEIQFGLICLTPESMNAPWLLFEAGALSKSQQQSRVWTVLYRLEYAEVKGPLSQFQHTKIEREDVSKLLRAINTAGGEPLLKESQLETAFRRGWPDLEQLLEKVPEGEEDIPDRPEKDMIKEVLELLRNLMRERQQSTYESDRYMSAFLPLLASAVRSDPKFKDSELMNAAEELGNNARVRLLFINDSPRKQEGQGILWDPASGSSRFFRRGLRYGPSQVGEEPAQDKQIPICHDEKELSDDAENEK